MQETVSLLQHQKLAYSVKELSKLVGICERKIWQEIKDKKLQSARCGKRVFLTSRAVDEWLSRAEVQ
jgi:excisionase family DNA binding protein